MPIPVNKIIAFIYWIRNVSFALQAVLLLVSLLLASSQDQMAWIPFIVNHTIFDWIVFFLILSVISTISIEHFEKK